LEKYVTASVRDFSVKYSKTFTFQKVFKNEGEKIFKIETYPGYRFLIGLKFPGCIRKYIINIFKDK